MSTLYVYRYLLEIHVHSMFRPHQSFKELVADFLSPMEFCVSEL